MKKLLLILSIFILASSVVLAEDVKENDHVIENQTILNKNSFLGGNFLKQPEQLNGKQLVKNEKSFLIFNIVINGKPITVKEK